MISSKFRRIYCVPAAVMFLAVSLTYQGLRIASTVMGDEVSRFPSFWRPQPRLLSEQGDDSSTIISAYLSENNPTLALLYPPGLFGGYRNQVIRLVALCVHARQRNISQLLLPSLVWSTQIDSQAYPIPMDWVFDIDYWNQQAAKYPDLPMLIDKVGSNENPSDCWKDDLLSQWRNNNTSNNISVVSLHPLQRASLQSSGYLQPILHQTLEALTGRASPFAQRRSDLLPLTEHCQHPRVHGGGVRAGRLWNEYTRYQRDNTTDPAAIIPFQMHQWVYRALRPAPRWRRLAHSCAHNNYVALHARVEVEMMAHRCGATMEKNLTRIVQQVQPLLHNRSLFLAVSRAGMQDANVPPRLAPVVRENIVTLQQLVETGGGTTSHVFECGERLLESYHKQHPEIANHGSLLQSALNFEVAVQADVFVGVERSSYSTDVFTTRYFLGKGSTNYRYTTRGVLEPVENGGLPLPHTNCAKVQQK